MIHFNCPSCGKGIKVGDAGRGRQASVPLAVPPYTFRKRYGRINASSSIATLGRRLNKPRSTACRRIGSGGHMGLSIRSISKAKFVECSGYVDEEADELCDHEYEICSFPLGREGLKTGCYVRDKGGRWFSFEIGYSQYARWIDELYRMLYGVDAKGVCRQFRRHRGKPFIEFLDVPSFSQGDTIGSKTSAKLHGDFVTFARRARKDFTQNKVPAWMWDTYRDFRKAFKIASDGGFMCYW